MASKPHRTKAAVARRVWKQFFDFLRLTVRYREEALTRLELTPNDARALSSLDLNAGRPMSSLASEWSTDASNTTWIVDRLEKKGWVERRLVADDRRVKLVVLTRLGLETKTELQQAMYRPPPELLHLALEDLELLDAAFSKLPTRSPSKPR